MIIPTHHFTNPEKNKVDVYWFEDRYRYTVTTDKGIEYRELGPDPNGLIETIPNTQVLETFIIVDTDRFPYTEVQYKPKCIRCSKPFGAPRKEYNLAAICNRCFDTMKQDTVTSASVWYEINSDGSKGNVIKE